MFEASGFWRSLRGGMLGRWVPRTLALAVVTFSVMYLVACIGERTPRWVYWKAGLVFLIGLEAAYGVVLGVSLAALPVLGVRLSRARGRRPWLARGVLLCVSVLLGLGVVEVGAAVWMMRLPRPLVAPAGRGTRPVVAPLRLAGAADDPVLPEQFPDSPASENDAPPLVVLGESSAAGVPYNAWVSVGHIVSWQLERVFPGRRFPVQILAESGVTLERQHARLAEITQRPSVLVIYCGHNEFSARLGAWRNPPYYRDEPPPSAVEVLAAWAERTSPLCRLIRESADKCRVAIPPTPGADRALVDVPAYTSEEFAALLSDFERRLEIMVAYAERIGSVPVLILPAANDTGFEPNRSYLPASTPYAERAAFAREFLAIRRREAEEPADCIARYRALLERAPGFAELHYRLGVLLERTGAWEEAYQQYVSARDLDGLPMRLPTRFQNVYRAVAARHACVLIDSQSYFHAIGRHGLLDDELFHDGMHPSLRGQIALAQAVLQGLCARRAFGWPEATPAPVVDPVACASYFGLKAYQWSSLCLWGIMFYDLTSPMHYDPTARLARQAAFAEAHNRIALDHQPAESVGLPNIGVPRAVPLVPDAAVLTRPPAAR